MGIVRGDEVLEDARGAGGADTLGAHHVLDADGDAGKGRGLPAGDAGVGLVRLLQGQLLGEGDVGLDPVLDLTDAAEHRLRQLTRGELLLGQELAGLVYGEIEQVQNVLPNGKARDGRRPRPRGPSLENGPDSEQIVLGPGGISQDILGREGVSVLVRAEDVLQRQGVGGGRHIVGVELAQDIEMVEDLG